MPEHFARHATAHAVGFYTFTKRHALIAAMLATSLAVQFREHEQPPS